MHKVTLVTPFYPPLLGGAEKANAQLSGSLAGIGVGMSVVTPRFRFSWKSLESANGVMIHRYPSWFPSKIPVVSDLAHSAYPFLSVPTILNGLQPDLVHIHYFYYPGYAAWQWAKKRLVPIVLTLAGNDVFDPFHSPCSFFIRYHKQMVQDAQRIIVPARVLLKTLESAFAADLSRIRVIPWGVDTERFAPGTGRMTFRNKYGIPSDALVVISVQRLHARKGVRFLLGGSEKLVLNDSERVHFCIVGDGPERPALEGFVRQNRLQDSVHLLGKISESDLLMAYGASDVFAMHSYHEGFGLVFLEAMASGLPVVTTRAGGAEELIQDGKTGLLVTTGQAQHLAHAILSSSSTIRICVCEWPLRGVSIVKCRTHGLLLPSVIMMSILELLQK